RNRTKVLVEPALDYLSDTQALTYMPLTSEYYLRSTHSRRDYIQADSAVQAINVASDLSASGPVFYHSVALDRPSGGGPGIADAFMVISGSRSSVTASGLAQRTPPAGPALVCSPQLRQREMTCADSMRGRCGGAAPSGRGHTEDVGSAGAG